MALAAERGARAPRAQLRSGACRRQAHSPAAEVARCCRRRPSLGPTKAASWPKRLQNRPQTANNLRPNSHQRVVKIMRIAGISSGYSLTSPGA